MDTKSYIFLILFVLTNAICLAQESFLKSYYLPNQQIQSVRKIVYTHSDPPYIVALDGVNTITNEFFTRVQAFDYDGNPVEGCEDAFAGTPLSVTSGLFFSNDSINGILTPYAEYSQDSLRYCMRWHYTNFSNFASNPIEFNGVFMPDSITTIHEFPSAIYDVHDGWNDSLYYIAGRALINGVNRCFVITADETGQLADKQVVMFPGLNFVSGILGKSVAIGRSTGWTGKAVAVDENSNVRWQQDFTDACDTSYQPLFTTPLTGATISSPYCDCGAIEVISYQSRDRVLHLATRDSDSFDDFYTMQLDSYIGAIPITSGYNTIIFCYLQNGNQYIRAVDFWGNVIWTSQLPGVGRFGRYCLTHFYYSNYIAQELTGIILVGAVLPEGGFYLAGLHMKNGWILNDYVNIPEDSDVYFYPNPVKQYLTIEYNVTQQGEASADLYNLKGQKVLQLDRSSFNAPGKYYRKSFIGRNKIEKFGNGLYLLRINFNGKTILHKVILRAESN